MKILVVGSGGREHAIIKKLKESNRNPQIYACPGNGGISKDAICVNIGVKDINGVVDFAKKEQIDLVVVAPDDPLVLGMVDALDAEGIATFGPNKAAAILEGSKVFSKALMKKYGIPTASYETFSQIEEAIAYIKQQKSYPIVIKADGLALGKGVIIAESERDAIAAVQMMMQEKTFGDSGANVVIEEFLTGTEVTVLAFTDGKTVKPMVSSMDHKRAFDGDKGLNTGGMGTIAPAPVYTLELQQQAMERVFLPTIDAMNAEGRPFKGCLYFGLILTANGPYVIEYNCRFGDPETQVVLPLLDTDFIDIIEAIQNEELHTLDVKWKKGSAACIIMASGGYPQNYEKGFPIEGLDALGNNQNAIIYHAGTTCEGNIFYTNGGRVLGVTAVSDSITHALLQAYKCCETIHWEKVFYRKDIGHKALEYLSKQEH